MHDSVEKLADKGLDTLEEKVLDGLDATRQFTENAVENSAELQMKAEVAAKALSYTVTDYVQQKPLQSAGIAFAAGILTTLILSRR